MRFRIVMVIFRPATVLALTLLFFAGGMASRPILSWVSGPSQSLAGCRVLIDPGHGGIDPGTGERVGLQEKDINLDMAFRLKRRLEVRGAEVWLTRWFDQELSFLAPGEAAGRHARDLWGRVHMARASGADLMLSLHVNYSGNPSERGSIVFYARTSEEGQILAGFLQKRIMPLQSYSAQKELPTGRFRVLKSTDCPAALIEMGFASNAEDRALFDRAQYRRELAEAIAAGVEDYFRGHAKGQ